MRIYTRKGDRGRTALRGGIRVPKTDVRIEACGACDELNAALGLARTCADDPELAALLHGAQSAIFAIGADIAATGRGPVASSLSDSAVGELERAIDAWEAPLPPLTNFILPGGTLLAAHLHVARTVCRRAERAVVAVTRQHDLSAQTLMYLNRLSDLLFVLARWANHRSGVADPVWHAGAQSGD